LISKEEGRHGTGAVTATESYEGSLTTEGIPGHHEQRLFTEQL
jgi:hypothetical protein